MKAPKPPYPRQAKADPLGRRIANAINVIINNVNFFIPVHLP
jgi:hypothetical protein